MLRLGCERGIARRQRIQLDEHIGHLNNPLILVLASFAPLRLIHILNRKGAKDANFICQ
jgi:hypothetical protein